MILTGEKCILRHWRLGDAPALIAIGNNAAIARNLSNRYPHPYTIEFAETFLNRVTTDPADDRQFAIEHQGALAGRIGYSFQEDVHAHTVEFGYWLGEAYWGRGIATDAIRTLVAHLWTLPQVERIEAGVFEWNPASARVLEKNGFRCEGCLRRSICKNGAYTGRFIYGLLRGE